MIKKRNSMLMFRLIESESQNTLKDLCIYESVIKLVRLKRIIAEISKIKYQEHQETYVSLYKKGIMKPIKK